MFSDDVYFTSIGGKDKSIGFSYADGAIKWRAVDSKAYTQTGVCRSLFPDMPLGDMVVLVEGEFDALALRSCGYDAFSVPAGANIGKSSDAPPFLKPVLEALEEDRIDVVVAVDADEKGKDFQEKLLGFLGRRRVGVIDWSKYGVKDANECLQTHGDVGIKNAFQEVENILYEGIVRASSVATTISDIRIGGFKGGAKIGIPSVDKLMTICSDQVSVVTGVPGSGKSEFIDFAMVSLAMREDWKFAIFSAENPIEIHAGKLIEKYAGKPLFEGAVMSEEDLEESAEWLDRHFFFLDPSSSHTIESILQRAAILVENEGVNGLVIDPFNYTDVALETDAINTMLTRLHAFAKQYHIHIWIVAHPQKMYRGEGGKLPTPGGMDISGSAAWFAKADFGVTVSRDENGDTFVVVWKVRFKWLGETGSAHLKYDPTCGRYSEGISIDDIADTLGDLSSSFVDEEDKDGSEKEDSSDLFDI
ncbi:MAG: putative ATP-dependent helicase [Prokaryotic dsDNA virus sp.]|nr:MAG: putative ATP-dependent helicase [Prokaryotic dsDNA virus sp.]